MTTALFTGDSITDAGRRTDPDGHLGAGYVRRIAEIAAADEVRLDIVNTGVSGDRAVDLLARWDADVARHAPDVLTILIGINDTWRRYDAADPTTGDEYAAAYTSMLERVRSELRVESLVIMEPFVVPVTPEQERWHAEDLNDKIAVARDLAQRYDATLVPLDRLFAERAAIDGPLSVVDDGVHPSAGGHELIAQAWWSAASLA
jgi:acyl-CoA thioesterase-1